MPQPDYPRSADTAMIFVVIATVCLANKGVFVRLALDAEMTVLGVLVLRALFATLLFWGVLRWREAPNAGSYTRRDCWLALACGNLFTLATALDIYVLSIMDVGISRAILFTFPLVVQVLGMFHTRRPPDVREIFAFTVAYGGILLVIGVIGPGELKAPVIGILCSLGCAVSYGAYLYYGRTISLRLGSSRFNLLSNLATCLVFLIAAPMVVTEADLQFGPESLGWIACLVVLSTVIPFILLFEGMRTVSAAKATLVSMAAPVITLSVAAYLFGERINGLQIVGFGFILLGVALLKLPLPFLNRVDSGRKPQSRV